MAERQAEIVIDDELVAVEPGQTARTRARLRNVSDQVVHYRLIAAPASPAAPWITIAPESVQLLESDDTSVDIYIQPPPGGSTAAGRVAYAVMADPGADSGVLPAVAEADVAVGAVHALDARLVPTRSRGRFGGRIRIRFNNLGNEDIRVAVTGSDEADDEVLHFATAEGRVTVPAGGRADAFVKMRPDKPIIIGKPAEHPFVITYRRRAARSAQLADQGSDDVAASVNGSFTQKPIIAKWMIVVALLAVALATLLYFVSRANQVDAVPRAPGVPELVDAAESDGVLRLTLDVDDDAAFVEVQFVEPPIDEQYDLATQIGATAIAEVASPRTVASAELDEATADDLGDDLHYRYRAVDADERVSIWQGGSVLRSDAVAFEAPQVQTVTWLDGETIEVVWTAPSDRGNRTLGYSLRDDGGTLLEAETSGLSARIAVPAEPFGVQVQAFDEDRPEDVSRWSELVVPDGDRPEARAFAAPEIQSVEWNDPTSVAVTCSAPADRRADQSFDYQYQDEQGGLIAPQAKTGCNAVLPLLAPIGVQVRAIDVDTGEQSAWSVAAAPQGEPPAVTTTTLVPPTTVADQQQPVGFAVLPQGLRVPDQRDADEWTILWSIPDLLDGTLQLINTDEWDLGGIQLPSGELVLADGIESIDGARAVCTEFLRRLSAASVGIEIGPCLILPPGSSNFERIQPEGVGAGVGADVGEGVGGG